MRQGKIVAVTGGAQLNVAIRFDVSRVVGAGHLIRCRTLAEALVDLGALVTVLTNDPDDRTATAFASVGNVEVFRKHSSSPVGGKASSLAQEFDWADDLAWTKETLRRTGRPFDWLIVDHYGIDARWHREIRSMTGKVLVIDDLANRAHDCDVLLDQNLTSDLETRYLERVPANCQMLLGPSFALLGRRYAECRPEPLPYELQRVRRVLVSFGASDRADLVQRTTRILARHIASDTSIDVVAGHAKTPPELANDPRFRWHDPQPSLAPLMANADAAVGAGGSTSWERLFMGLPAVVVTLANNQVPATEELHRRGLVDYVGSAEHVTDEALEAALLRLLSEPRSKKFLAASRELVDGLGVARVCKKIRQGTLLPLAVRRAAREDEALLLAWANDSAVRAFALDPRPISVSTHRAWFARRLAAADDVHLHIAISAKGDPVGQVRIERADARWEIHYSVARAFRGAGLGRPMLQAVLAAITDNLPDAVVFGRVKRDNIASIRVFESLGFDRVTELSADVLEFESSLTDGLFASVVPVVLDPS